MLLHSSHQKMPFLRDTIGTDTKLDQSWRYWKSLVHKLLQPVPWTTSDLHDESSHVVKQNTALLSNMEKMMQLLVTIQKETKKIAIVCASYAFNRQTAETINVWVELHTFTWTRWHAVIAVQISHMHQVWTKHGLYCSISNTHTYYEFVQITIYMMAIMYDDWHTIWAAESILLVHCTPVPLHNSFKHFHHQ